MVLKAWLSHCLLRRMEMQKQIEPLFNSLVKDQELELSLYEYLASSGKTVGIGYGIYRKLVAYMGKISAKQELELKRHTIFDLILEYNGSEYRLSITGIDTINRLLNMVYTQKNYVAARVLLRRFADNHAEDEDNITFMQKSRINKIDLTSYAGRIRASNEIMVSRQDAKKISEKLDYTASKSILFRYKQRLSLEISDSNGLREGFDLTAVKQGIYISAMENANENYEAELELMRHSAGKNNPKTLDHFIKTAMEIFQVIDNTDINMTREAQDKVLAAYRKLSNNMRPSLEVRNSISMQLYHATDVIANKYGVLDKAEGERYIAIVDNNHIYLISNNLHVRDAGIDVDSEWNGTILDGEFMLDSRMFLAFDTLFYKGKDVRDNPSLRERMALIDEIVKIILPAGCILNKKSFEYKGDMELSKLVEYYTNYATENYRIITANMKNIPKKGVLFQKKLCLMLYGVHDSEIFCYMNIILTLYDSGLVPYVLDGLILTPLQHKYTNKRAETTLSELKLKDIKKNSIDFFLKYVRNESTNKIAELFNNCDDSELKGKPYRIAYLYVGNKQRSGEEMPVLFIPEKKLYEAYLYVQNGDVYDIEGNPVIDGTVVEAYYNNDPKLKPNQRWTIMRTRWDKTESVMRYKSRYGNNEMIARNVWNSIQTPFKFSDVAILANRKSFDKHMTVLKGHITPDMAIELAKETSYYAKQSKLMEQMRNFHNFVKSIIMYPYLNPRYNTPHRMIVLDIGCGRGGDLPKLFYSRVTMAVGIDPDYENINSVVRGCINTYKQMRRTRENVPPMYFLQASATAPFNAKAQKAALGTMTPESMAGITKFFEGTDKQPATQFDAINCQFALHYMLKNEVAFGNFCDNINQTLRPGGWFLATCFDADLIIDALGKEGKHILNYTDEDGSRKILHEITKRFELTDAEQKSAVKNGYGLGCAIDMYNASFMHEGTVETEYLVDKRFLVREFAKRCGLEVVDTGLFSSVYKTNHEFFKKVAPWESSDPTYLLKVRKFYNLENEIDRLSYEITRLNRYYVFRKTGTPEELEAIKQQKVLVKKAPLKQTKEVASVEEDTKKPRKPTSKSQKGGKKKPETSSDESSSEEEESEEEEKKTKKASRGLTKPKATKGKKTHVPKEAEDEEIRTEADARANGNKSKVVSDSDDEEDEDDSSTDDEDISEEDPDI
jgi:SAM-dependent methyltransferase